MTEPDTELISSKIEAEKEYLQYLSQKIWENPELRHEEKFAHSLLTEALEKYGFHVQKHYLLPTAFRAEFSNNADKGPTIAVICEYDALPEINHACGHNLIAEAGIAAGMSIKHAMETDSTICGKIVVIGTPAEEGGSGKALLIDRGAFHDIDVALMVHPARMGWAFPDILALSKLTVTFKGKESHASGYPWEGKNALDAAVASYNNISLLRQHMKPTHRMHGIITKGGVAPNIIPGESEMKYFIRAPTAKELRDLKERVKACFESAALATGCEVSIKFSCHDEENLITNKILGTLFKKYADSFGLKFADDYPKIFKTAGSTDMGNVSHVVPAIHPFYGIGGKSGNHTKGFTQTAASSEAQISTLSASKAMALVAIKMMRSPDLVLEVKEAFREDVIEESKNQ